MHIWTYTEARLNQHENQDYLGAIPHPAAPGHWIFALADGQSGHPGGSGASQVAVKTCLELALQFEPYRLMQKWVWKQIFEQVDAAVAANSEAGFTTLIAGAINADKICGASVGDSAALAFSATQHIELTKAQKAKPLIGSGQTIETGFGSELEAGCQIVLMSDGVWRYVGFETIAGIGRSLPAEEATTQIRAHHVTESGLFDDFSLIWFSS